MCSDTLSHGAHVGDAGSNFVPNPFKPLFSVQSLAMVLVVYFVLFFILDFIYFLYFSSLFVCFKSHWKFDIFDFTKLFNLVYFLSNFII